MKVELTNFDPIEVEDVNLDAVSGGRGWGVDPNG